MLPTRGASMLAMKDNVRLLGLNLAYLVAIKATTRAALADAMGISTQAVGQVIRGDTKELKPSNLVKAAKLVGLSSDDLVTRDLRRENWHPATHLRVAEPGAKYDVPLLYLPVLSLAGSGGPGTEDDELEIIDELAFKVSWVKKNRWEPKQLYVAGVKGNSMAHWMPEGNKAVIHRGDSVIRDNDDPYDNVFALMDGSAFRYKKIVPAPDGSIILRSFNEDKKQYPDERRAGQEVDSIMLGIIGRVVWRGG